MGADLIGYHLKGPRRLDKATRVVAEQYAENVIGQARHLFLPESYDLYTKRGYLDWTMIFKDFPDLKPVLTSNAADGVDYEGVLENIFDMDPGEVVNNLFAVWEGGARDASCRQDPDDPSQVIIFAGNMSWGDEPDGYGYTSLRDAALLGLFPIFGIR